MFKVERYEPNAETEVAIYAKREDIAELFMWLSQLNTGFMNDQQYMYFNDFKKKLQVIAAEATLTRVKEQFPTHEKFEEVYGTVATEPKK